MVFLCASCRAETGTLCWESDQLEHRKMVVVKFEMPGIAKVEITKQIFEKTFRMKSVSTVV